MPDKPPSRRCVVGLWCANIAFVLMTLAAAVVVDGNGCLPGLDEAPSVGIVFCILAGGLSLDFLLGIVDKKRRPLTVALGLVYLAMLISVVGSR